MNEWIEMKWTDQYIQTYFVYSFGIFSQWFALFCVIYEQIRNVRLNHMGVYHKKIAFIKNVLIFIESSPHRAVCGMSLFISFDCNFSLFCCYAVYHFWHCLGRIVIENAIDLHIRFPFFSFPLHSYNPPLTLFTPLHRELSIIKNAGAWLHY